MIDYDRAEAEALRLLTHLRSAQKQRRCKALHLACGIAALEFALLVAGAFYAF
jgi:hypothetical protein